MLNSTRRKKSKMDSCVLSGGMVQPEMASNECEFMIIFIMKESLLFFNFISQKL